MLAIVSTFQEVSTKTGEAHLSKVLQPITLGVRPETTYGYDVMSNLTSITDAELRVTTFRRDSYNRVDKITYPGQRDENFTFDLSGRVSTRVRGGTTTTYGYDALNRLTSKTFSDGTPAYSYTYDENADRGFMTSAAHGGHTLSWNYDLAGQLRTEASSAASGPTETVAYTYDLAGNRVSLSLNGAAWLTYDHDDASRLDKIQRGAEVFDFSYDDAHRRTRIDFPNLVKSEYGYDSLSRLLSLTTTKNQTAIASSEYTFDDAGNRLTKTHPGSYAETYLYDPLDRLHQVTRDSVVSEQYTYDKVGNRNPPAWTYSDRNELVASSSGTFGYDLRGNLTTKGEGGDTWTYEWNAENQLTRVLKNTIEQARFAYDPLGRRVEKVGGGATLTYVYDGEDILRRHASTGGYFTFIHGPGIDEALGRQGSDAIWRYFLADGLGSIVKTTNLSGAVVLSTTYDAFGGPSGGLSAFAFTGREWDAETGLYYYRARYYDPKIGRFISEDPIGFKGGINFFAYVENNPVNYTDPYGLLKGPDPFTTIGVCAVTGIGAAGTAATTAGLALFATTANVGSDWAPGEPRPPVCQDPPACGKGDDDETERICKKQLQICLTQQTQNRFRQRQWGRQKDCGACYRECKAAGGAWPYYKCPLFEN